MKQTTELDRLCANTIRTLAMDGVQKAKSGHPGMSMGAADMAYVLWTRFLRHNPNNPFWPNRDRFVLSAGHGSMLLYSLLHLTGYDLSLEDLERFRQWDSETPGHPEYAPEKGIETTTGPLGQGFTTGVGMAIAERFLAARFNRPGYPVVDHHIYAIVSDGDLMEGVSSEAASLAGHLELGNLIYLYDDNHISIEGSTDLTFSEDVEARFRAYGWRTQRVDGHDMVAVAEAIGQAQMENEHPSLILARTHIGWGSPNKQDKSESHGSPLGEDEVRLTKQKIGWSPDARFHIPEEALAVFRRAQEQGAAIEEEWRRMFGDYAREYPELAEQWERLISGELPDGWEKVLPTFKPEDGQVPTRSASGKVLNALVAVLPGLLGGSADLHPSTNTYLKGFEPLKPGDFSGRNVHFGIREHAMGGILNGLALYGGIIPFGGTFLVFSDYMRPAIRLAAMMGLPVKYVFTHDSIGLGEDGPTHQPIEQMVSLRTVPNLLDIRPADANETVEAWRVALKHNDGPTALFLTRQNVPVLDRSKLAPASELARGAYVLLDVPDPELILIASGSEVEPTLAAQALLAQEGIAARVVNMASWKLFSGQPEEYRAKVLPPNVKARLAVEAGISQGWHAYVGDGGDVISIERFGASAPYKTLMKEFGFSPENIAARAKALLSR